ncbi:hypothetical protein [Serratia rhizosphaerae]|uniref:Uncharacterized protein n=1 Tax=Serratia rhizosphaerae TaxID=2597702 RepID=A0ABX6GHB1_9GAMM|nr:hypothetical protein [Serratia rhizosphaerae]MEB6335626.1 hypothetical protein [Serratia rhizosphaerae]QHA85661.1 hypothetical protein FO014_00945 [Serratia rhizosphaerae]
MSITVKSKKEAKVAISTGKAKRIKLDYAVSADDVSELTMICREKGANIIKDNDNFIIAMSNPSMPKVASFPF